MAEDNRGKLILDQGQILQKVRRMSYEIYENNYEEKELVIAGVYDRGYRLAEMLRDELKNITPFNLKLVKVSLNKKTILQSDISLDCESKALQNKVVILVDDVLNSGRTLAYSLRPFLTTEIKKIEVAVLVNRSHTSFPIGVKYTGLELSTTLNEHVEVRFTEDQQTVYLS